MLLHVHSPLRNPVYRFGTVSAPFDSMLDSGLFRGNTSGSWTLELPSRTSHPARNWVVIADRTTAFGCPGKRLDPAYHPPGQGCAAWLQPSRYRHLLRIRRGLFRLREWRKLQQALQKDSGTDLLGNRPRIEHPILDKFAELVMLAARPQIRTRNIDL